MTNQVLSSRGHANKIAARIFQGSRRCRLSVCEETAFENGACVPIGGIELFPAATGSEPTLYAVRHGSFEWTTPSVTDATADLTRVLGASNLSASDRPKANDKIRRILDSIGATPVRLGLVHPIFDPRSLSAMPFRRPTTILSDTSGVIQGALSFVARFLYPAARIKIPAVVQMEVVNFADRFLSNRRSQKPRRIDLLGDHLKSQAGQRVLLQLELHSDVELERTFLLGDPLRGAFQREEDKELRELNISVPIRAYADRLILEAARQHQSQVSYGHPVMLLTSDQGLARMAMAEGVEPLYFHSIKTSIFFGRRLAGTNFSPFSGELTTSSVADVLWELATIFGCAKLEAGEGGAALTIRAIGKELSWAPYHSHDDLLWVESTPGLSEGIEGDPTEPEKPEGAARSLVRPKSDKRRVAPAGRSLPRKIARDGPARYKFSVDRLIRLIDTLDSEQRLPLEKVYDALGVQTASAIEDYRRFLESGAAIAVDELGWEARPILTQFSVALRHLDIDSLSRILREFPSYAELAQALGAVPVGAPYPVASLGRASSTYQALAEVTCLGAPIFGLGFFSTPARPSDEKFAEMALRHYQKLEQGNGWVATGLWLEELIQKEGVHPLVARSMLQSTSERRLIRRVTEGSTTETKFDRHIIRVLEVRQGAPAVGTVHIYRGDFLIPGKSSSSLKIEEVSE